MKLMMPRLLSMFLMANDASFGMLGETLMMFSATSLMDSTSASNSTLPEAGVVSLSGVTVAVK